MGPIDYAVLSNFCLKCKIAADKPEDIAWQSKHAPNCPKILMEQQEQCKILKLQPGENLQEFINHDSRMRIELAERAATEQAKKGRKRRKFNKLVKDQQKRAKEGDQYASRTFDC